MSRLGLGVDIGGTSVKIGLLDESLRVLATAAVETGSAADPDDIVGGIAAALASLGREAPDGGTVASIGIGCAGLIDLEHGVVRLSPNLPTWRDVPLRERVQTATGLPTSLINDADAFGYAEGRYGAGQGCRAGLFVTLGTGVGGAILLDGELYRGARGLAGEFGHMSVDIHGAPCPCGNRGCLETYVGSRHIVDRARRLVQSGAPGQVIQGLADGEDGLTPATLARAAAEGDWTARTAFAEAGEILGIALAGVMNLLSLDVIVIGGGVSAAGDPLWEPAIRAFRAHCMVPPDRQPAVLPSQFGAQAGLVGAGAWARDHATG